MSSSTGVFELLAGTALSSADVVAFVDVSDSTQAPQGSLLKITMANFFATVPSAVNITSATATAFCVGRLGGTSTPAFTVDASTALQVAGLKVVGAVTTGTVAVVVTDSGAVNTNLTINALNAGTIGIGSVSTGRVTITPVTTITGAVTHSSTLTQTGLATFNGGATVASGQTLTVTGATITGLTAASVATGTFPGVYTVTGALTLSAALTYGGVTLSNAVTGTGNMVLSAGPTLTGTVVLTGTTITGAPTWSSSQAITLSTAAQPSITSVGTLTSLTVSGAINAGNVVKFTDNALGTAATYWIGAANTTRLYFNVPTGSGFEFLTNNSGSISMVAGVLTVPSGLTVSAGTTAVQALTATTVIASLGVQVTGGSTGTGKIIQDATTGLQIRCVAGATYNFELANAAGSSVLLISNAAPTTAAFQGPISATTGTLGTAPASAVAKGIFSDGTYTTGTDLTTANILGALVSATSANASGSYMALHSQGTQSVATTGSYSGGSCVAQATHTSGTVASLIGTGGSVYVTGSGGTTTDAWALDAAGVVGAGATVTNLYGIRMRALTNSGTLTNAYGIHVGAVTAGSTLNYALYTTSGRIHFGSLPTSSAGLASGDIWANSNVLTVVP